MQIDLSNYLTIDLLRPKYKKAGMPKSYGHCYVASEVLYHLWAKDKGYKPYCARDEEDNVHWWLMNNTGDILDPTVSQYEERDLEPPYSKGRCCGFLTKGPSKRALIVLNRNKGVNHGTRTS